MCNMSSPEFEQGDWDSSIRIWTLASKKDSICNFEVFLIGNKI